MTILRTLRSGRRRIPCVGAAGVLLVLLVPPVFAADPDVDRLLASQCAQCHGTDGNAVGEIDGLAGESFAELFGELLEMRYEDRAEDIMEHQARGYTEEQLHRIATYFASRPEGDRD